MDAKLKCLLKRMDAYLGMEQEIRERNPYYKAESSIIAMLQREFPGATKIYHLNPENNDTIYGSGGYVVDSVFIWYDNAQQVRKAILKFKDVNTNQYANCDRRGESLNDLIALLKK